MANTFLQIHLHVVFAVKYREALIDSSFQDRLYKYIIAIFQNHGHKVLAIGGVADHIHVLLGYDPREPLPSLMQQVKRDSSRWINEQGFLRQRFLWQEGYGAFAVCKRHLDVVVRYILNQEEHHRVQTLVEEYVEMLENEGLEFRPERIFSQPV